MTSPYSSKTIKTPNLQIGETSICPKDLVRNPEVMCDKFIKINDYATSIYRAAYYHLKNIRSFNDFCQRTHLLVWSISFLQLAEITLTLCYMV